MFVHVTCVFVCVGEVWLLARCEDMCHQRFVHHEAASWESSCKDGWLEGSAHHVLD
jgi:hypothetical protein